MKIHSSRLPRTLLSALSSLLLLGSAAHAEDLILINKNGQSIEASVTGQNEGKITIKRSKDGKEFTIPLDSLNEDSQKKVQKELKRLATSYPPIKVDVVIGKRRQDYEGSDYRKLMEITSKTTLTNTDLNRSSPPCMGNILILGQDQRSDYKYKILSNQEFNLTPGHRGVDFEAKPVRTVYDSDNKGYGNIGGYKYVGYIIIITDEKEKEIIHYDSNYSKAKKAMEMSSKLITEIREYSAEKMVDENLKPLDVSY